jgi:MtN3 and saliva related transmembrane protein
MTFLASLATIFGAGMGLANFPQVYKIFRRKSAKDISILTYCLLLSGAIIWVLYGIEISNFPIIIANSLGTISVFMIVVGWFLYGRSR